MGGEGGHFRFELGKARRDGGARLLWGDHCAPSQVSVLGYASQVITAGLLQLQNHRRGGWGEMGDR